MEKHNKLIDILIKYGNKEFGENIIDEISELQSEIENLNT